MSNPWLPRPFEPVPKKARKAKRKTFALFPDEKKLFAQQKAASGFRKDGDFVRMRVLNPAFDVVDRLDRILQRLDQAERGELITIFNLALKAIDAQSRRT